MKKLNLVICFISGILISFSAFAFACDDIAGLYEGETRAGKEIFLIQQRRPQDKYFYYRFSMEK